MLFTKITLNWQSKYRSKRWHLWCLACLIFSCASLAWAQIPPPTPGLPLPPLLGARVTGETATSDTVFDFALESGSVLSGKVIDVNGVAVMSATVLAQSETGIFRSSITVDFDPNNPTLPQFKYRLVVPDGTYNIFVTMSVIDVAATPPQLLSTLTFDLQETVVVAGATERDFMVPGSPPFSTLTGQVSSLGTLPSEGGLWFQSEDGRVSNITRVEIAEGATQATYRITLPAGTYQVSFLVTLPESLRPDVDNPVPPPPPDPEVPQQSVLIPLGTVTVSADQVFDLNVPAIVTLAGKLLDGSGIALAGASIFATSGLPQTPPPSPSPTRAFCQAGSLSAAPIVAFSSASLLEGNTLGDYELLVVPGDYQVGVTTPVELLPPATVPPSTLDPQQGSLTFPFPLAMMSITEDQIADFVLPSLPAVVLISGRVTDQQNQPVGKARVNAVSSMLTAAPNVLFSNSVEANELGDYQLLVLSGVDYTVTVCPPEPMSLIETPTL